MRELLGAWGLEGATCMPLTSGLINQTWQVETGAKRFILQSLNTTIFDPILHEDIEAVTRHLASAGRPTPRLVRTGDGALWHGHEGGCWRLMTVVGDRTVESLSDSSDAAQAGALVGRFHNATRDLEWTFRNPRSQAGFHDTPKRLAHLREVLDRSAGDAFFEPVSALAARIEVHRDLCQEIEGLPRRVVHGDLKVSNIRFQGGEACALIDLDTLARGTLDAELGDAFRSWCNRSAEGDSPRFDLGLFGAAVRGYASEAHGVVPLEWQSFVVGTIRICLELSSRFAADAIERCYFGFDETLGSGEHNLRRARSQLALAEQVLAVREEAEALVREAFLEAR